MAGIEPQPGIMEIALYQGGKSSVEGVSNVVKLSSNENPFGPSPAAQESPSSGSNKAAKEPARATVRLEFDVVQRLLPQFHQARPGVRVLRAGLH